MQIDHDLMIHITSFNFFDRLEEKRCMRKQEEEKALNFHLEGFQFSGLILSVA